MASALNWTMIKQMLKLLINPVRVGDSSRYTCGNEEVVLDVYILHKPMIRNYTSDSILKAKVNEAVSLECQWSGKRVIEPIMNWYSVGSSPNQNISRSIHVMQETDDNNEMHLSYTMNMTITADDSTSELICAVTYRIKNLFMNSYKLVTDATDWRFVDPVHEWVPLLVPLLVWLHWFYSS